MGTSKRDKANLITFFILMIGALVLAFAMVEPLVPFIVFGGILAILSQPLFFFFQRRHLGPRVAAFVVVFIIFVVVAGPFSFFLSHALQQGVALGQDLSKNSSFSIEGVINKVQSWKILTATFGDPEKWEERLRTGIQTSGKAMTDFLVIQLTSLPTVFFHSVIALVSCFFFLTDGRAFVSWFANKIPLDQDVRSRVTSSFKNTSVSVIWATLAAAGSQSLVILIAFLALQLPNAFLAAGATFLFAWIPIIGCSPVWIAGSIYLISQGAYLKMVILIALGLLAGVVDNFVRPLVLRGRSNMHPVVSLIAIFGGIRMFGVLGIFYGPIIAAVAIALLQVWPIVGRRFGLSFGVGTDEMKIEPEA